MKRRILQLMTFMTILVALDWAVAAFFQKGLEHYYGLDQEADILIVGHSHMMKTCNKRMLEEGLGLKVSKYCREAVMVPDRYAMVRQFLDTQQDHSVPIVLYGVDPRMFFDGQLSYNSYKLFYPFMDDPAMDELVRREAVKWHDYPIHKYIRSSRFPDFMMYRSARGWLNYWDSLSDGVISEEKWNKPHPWDVYMPEKTVRIFHETVDLLLENGCHVVLVYPGTIQAYQKSNPEAHEFMMNYFRTMADNHPGIDFLDYGPIFSHRREYFEDSVHINRAGEKVFVHHLIKDLQEIMNKIGYPAASAPGNP